MPRDNYRDRVEDYQRYQDYKYDQRVFQQDLSTRTAEVYSALSRRDYDSAAWALRIPGHSASSSGMQATFDEPRVQTLAKQTFALIRDINESAYIATGLQSNWVCGLEKLPDIDCKQALDRIVDFKIAFSAWKLSSRPDENIWDIGNTKIWLFDSQVFLIECKIDRIRRILEDEIQDKN